MEELLLGFAVGVFAIGALMSLILLLVGTDE
jgi:hypothetical protein